MAGQIERGKAGYESDKRRKQRESGLCHSRQCGPLHRRSFVEVGRQSAMRKWRCEGTKRGQMELQLGGTRHGGGTSLVAQREDAHG